MTVTSVGRALSAYGAALKRAEGVTPGTGDAGSSFAGMVKAGLESTRADLRAGEDQAVQALSGRRASRMWWRPSPRPSSACRK